MYIIMFRRRKEIFFSPQGESSRIFHLRDVDDYIIIVNSQLSEYIVALWKDVQKCTSFFSGTGFFDKNSHENFWSMCAIKKGWSLQAGKCFKNIKPCFTTTINIWIVFFFNCFVYFKCSVNCIIILRIQNEQLVFWFRSRKNMLKFSEELATRHHWKILNFVQ